MNTVISFFFNEGTGHHIALVSFGCIVFALNGDLYKQYVRERVCIFFVTNPSTHPLIIIKSLVITQLLLVGVGTRGCS